MMLTDNLFLLHSQVDSDVLVSDSPFVECDCSDGDTEEMVLPQYHHCTGGWLMLLLQKQHRAATLTPLYAPNIHKRDLLFITAEHKLPTHCSVVSIQSVLVSKVLIY